MGLVIVGDHLYGCPEKAILHHNVLGLCCASLSFTHPITGEEYDFELKNYIQSPDKKRGRAHGKHHPFDE